MNTTTGGARRGAAGKTKNKSWGERGVWGTLFHGRRGGMKIEVNATWKGTVPS
jgi:hypothetical protein